MEQSDPTPPSCESPLPERLLSRLAGLPRLFTRPTWQNVLLLVAGAILAPGKRTVTAALRILGRERENDFPTYHGVLNRAVWSSRAVAGWLLRLLVATFVGVDATVVIGIDDTIERRWGHKISARGIYRDPVRSSKGHFVKTSGLRWLSAQLLVHIPWAGRIMGLPFLTVLAPSKRFYAGKPRPPRTLLDCARQAALQIHRWLPGRRIVIVGDTAFAAIEFLGAVRNYVSVVIRLRLDANLYAPAPPRRPSRGRPAVKSLPTLTQVLHDAGTVWQRRTVTLWYGRTNRAGSFGSPAEDGVDGFLAVFGEVFDALDRLEAEPAQHCQCRVAQCGERLGRMTGVGAPLVFPVGNISDVVQAVLDAPVFTRQGEQGCGIGFISGQAGDGVDGFRGFFVTHDALARQAADLGQTTPGRCQVLGDAGGGLQATGLDPAVAFLDRLGLCEVRRRRPFRTGGNRARRPVRCPLSVPVGCP
jgi:hypothetical protein